MVRRTRVKQGTWLEWLAKAEKLSDADSLCVQAEVIGLSGKGDDLCKRIRGISGDSKVLL